MPRMTMGYSQQLNAVENASELVGRLERQLKEAKQALGIARANFKKSNDKRLKEAEEAGILVKSGAVKGHYKIKGTNISVCVDEKDRSVELYDYDRKDYFAESLLSVEAGETATNKPIDGVLSAREKAAVRALADHVLRCDTRLFQ